LSWKATAYVKGLKVAQNDEPVTRSEKLFLFVLADSHNEERKAAWPSVPKIARAALLSERRVREIAAACRLKGIICWDVQVATDGGTDNNLYHFCKLDCDHDPMARAELPKRPGGRRKTEEGMKKSQGEGVREFQGGGDEEISPGGSEPSQEGDANSPSGGDATARSDTYIEPPVQPPLEPTHTPAGAPSQSAPQPRAGVCVNSKFSLKERKRWARWKASFPNSVIRDPEALARARADGKDDEEIEEFLQLEEQLREDVASRLPLFDDCTDTPTAWPKLPPPQEREEVATAAWCSITEQLRGRVSPQGFDTWIAPLTPVRIREGVLLIHAPNAIVCDWVQANYTLALDAAVVEAANHDVHGIAFMRPNETEGDNCNADL
jgi:hypothetical protein